MPFYRKYICYLALACTWGCHQASTAIKIKGSDTEVNLVAILGEHFYRLDKRFSLAISGGGSGLGIASLLNGQADIANSSRPMNSYEDSLFRKRKIAIRTVIFAEDAAAIIVHRDFPLDSIAAPVLGKIFSGAYRNWKPLTGINMPINIYGRQSNSGTHDFIKKKLGIEFSERAKEMNGNAQIIEGIKTDRSGIGYVGAGYIAKGNQGKPAIKVLKIMAAAGQPAISPLDEQAIMEHRYFFQRPLYQFIRADAWNKVQPFLDFERTEQGISIIRSAGYYYISPVSPPQ